MQTIQYRKIQDAEISADLESRSITGYGIVFNSDSLPLTVWDDDYGVVEVVEQISSESLRGADMDDVISAFNHDFDKVLGRTTSNTMKLIRDAKGIQYKVNAPKTSYADDVLELLKRGDISGSSFVFSMDWKEGYEIEERDDGTLLAIPKHITKIYEMGPVINPAYPETTAENRAAGLERAIKRFLNAKRKEENREEQPGEGEQPKAEVNTQNQDITYPVTVTYKTKAKVMQLKNKRV